jgi:hypothetical protein
VVVVVVVVAECVAVDAMHLERHRPGVLQRSNRLVFALVCFLCQ